MAWNSDWHTQDFDWSSGTQGAWADVRAAINERRALLNQSEIALPVVNGGRPLLATTALSSYEFLRTLVAQLALTAAPDDYASLVGSANLVLPAAPYYYHRKFARQIWTLSYPGIVDQVARFTTTINEIWWATIQGGTNFGQGVTTPENERYWSGQIFRHDGSNWVHRPDLDESNTDTVEEIGTLAFIREGDWFGPHIINFLRDNLNNKYANMPLFGSDTAKVPLGDTHFPVVDRYFGGTAPDVDYSTLEAAQAAAEGDWQQVTISDTADITFTSWAEVTLHPPTNPPEMTWQAKQNKQRHKARVLAGFDANVTIYLKTTVHLTWDSNQNKWVDALPTGDPTNNFNAFGTVLLPYVWALFVEAAPVVANVEYLSSPIPSDTFLLPWRPDNPDSSIWEFRIAHMAKLFDYRPHLLYDEFTA